MYHSNSTEEELDRRKKFYKNLNALLLVHCLYLSKQIIFNLYKTTIIIGFVQLYFELRQFIWNPIEYMHSIWNLFDLAAFLFPTITSFLWVINHNNIPNWAISLSCLFLNIKFLLFFRAFESFGIYFAIIFGVIRRISSFLLILVIIIASFALSFHLLLIDEFSNDSTILFLSFQNSLLATYLFLSDTGLITSSIRDLDLKTDNATFIILMILFSLLIVIYLMNLFIGLLNIRWKHWFPEVIHYKVRKDVMRKYVREAINNGKWKSDDEYREKVLKQIDMLDLIQ
ncbi:hypothetical protein RhiirA5_425056 [Rhizophagus irregularis]|uniref:Ion transport domain-containing protein n=2 Tax=Rhizophagus irregularis TaxID=588596 RepID=A0A2I1EIU9_9GLOM|nr:hypothetical protein GLOIN_2v1766079 [Rhizophagus irregularis DAOM 181602=DAOM 197198]PKC02569.1 hypothetical protein RhiirA5_425056 [Rhizophagus irregularis]PKC73853.1 hypothetical protein RhiirA1_450699 [Rhizophagus irregularis]PKY22045.1 hypothetical protein RhiirB3_435830 [Rhizophagus irregularis]POG79030.1 hypothetical protein GLOIN_2v1766079 [Rhizophagus irregularis DAOM 181602=DAOM 197198]|eukprot:XP_025185896.1 hypothetical protein GLOIN_2v1766079 [Rhizophagus irregularis DAOM 181602=DAOM 197198]